MSSEAFCTRSVCQRRICSLATLWVGPTPVGMRSSFRTRWLASSCWSPITKTLKTRTSSGQEANIRAYMPR
jgi:hypothetical protein